MPPPLIVDTKEDFITNLIVIFVMMPLMIYLMLSRSPSTEVSYSKLADLHGPQVLVSIENGTAKFRAINGIEKKVEVDHQDLEIGAMYAVEDHPFRSKWGQLHSYFLKKC